jgi:hypothetical protein
MIELLAITDDATPLEPPLVAVRSGGLSALCAPAEETTVTADTLWRREEVLEALMEDRDLLPVRFGTLVADEAAAARALADRRSELEAGLERVRGAVELSLRVHAPEPADAPPPDAASGSEYMRAKATRTQAAARLHEPLAALARASALRPAPELLRAAYLVDREAVEPFVARVRELQDEHPALSLLCTGPWPPYSFAEEGS